MKEEYRSFRPGDRLQMVECRDKYAPVLPGTKGVIGHIDDIGGLKMSWDDGRTLGVCLEEDIVRKVPPEQEMELLNAEPLMKCDEAEWDAHVDESNGLVSAMQRFADEYGCDWVVKRIFIDDAHSSRPAVYEYLDGRSLQELIESCDLKNGTDMGFMAKRPREQQSAAIVVYGQGYTTPTGGGIVTELLECRPASPGATRDFRERIETGWDPSGKTVMRLFHSTKDHQPLAPLVRECRELARASHGKDRTRER